MMTKKTIFLFLLFPMICGAVSVKAQVRISGGSAAHPSSVLDLNPTNTANAVGGVLLPRVLLDSLKHTGVFGDGITIPEGLMVYNLNDGSNDRPKRGIYCYTGEEWVFVGGIEQEQGYTGYRFSISVSPKNQSLWLGRDGELTKEIDVNIPWVPQMNVYAIHYIWYFKDPDSKLPDDHISVTTDKPVLERPAGIIRGKVYDLSVAVRIVDYETAKVPVGHAVYGIGAWTGPGQWLTVANANVGADQNLTLEEQLAADHRTDYNRKVVGDYFQWGRLADGHQLFDSDTIGSPIPVSELDSITGQPANNTSGYGKFITTSGSDWREYPETVSDRKPWYWRAPGSSTGGDPCDSLSLPPDASGKWYVMTGDQWASISAHNRIAPLDNGRAQGFAVYPDPDSDNISFYIPLSLYRHAETGELGCELIFTDYPVNQGTWICDWSGNNRQTSLWLNSIPAEEPDKALMLLWNKNGEGGTGTPFSRANGAPVRCVLN